MHKCRFSKKQNKKQYFYICAIILAAFLET